MHECARSVSAPLIWPILQNVLFKPEKILGGILDTINPSSAPCDYSCPGIYWGSESGEYSSPSEEVTVYFISRGLRKQLKVVLQELVAAAFL